MSYEGIITAHSLCLRGPFARSISASRPEQQSLTLNLAMGPGLPFQHRAKVRHASSLPWWLCPDPWKLSAMQKTGITKAQSTVSSGGKWHGQLVQNSKQHVINCVWVQLVIRIRLTVIDGLLLSLACNMGPRLDVFAVGMLYVTFYFISKQRTYLNILAVSGGTATQNIWVNSEEKTK